MESFEEFNEQTEYMDEIWGGWSCYIIYFQSVNGVSQRPGEAELVLGHEVPKTPDE